MIVVRFNSGFGNQIFQYCLAKSISLQTSDEFILHDLSWYKIEYKSLVKRNFLLENYAISGQEVSEKHYFFLKFIYHNRFLKYLPIFKLRLVQDRKSGFMANIRNLKKGNYYLNGFFQSYKYFKDIRDNLMNDFTPNIKFSDEYNFLKLKIANSNSICVHIRRGDYLSNPKANLAHGIIGQEYYTKAFNHFGKGFKYFIFCDSSNDIVIPYEHEVVSLRGLSDLEEFELMRNCKNYIICNSTFSWCAAYFTYSDIINSQVIYPDNWANFNFVKDDLFPSNWISK